MKKLIKYIMVMALLFIGCQKDDIGSANQEELTGIDFKEITEFILDQQGNLNSKGLNNGNGIYFVPFISNATENWTLVQQVPNTSLLSFLEYPQEGEDRLIIFSGDEMMVNWTTQEPRLFMTDLNDGIVKYSNWCDENKTGFYHINGKSTWFPVDLNGDGETDIYGWDTTTLDKNFNMKVKTTLTDSQISDTWVFPVQGDCRAATEEVEFSYQAKLSNGTFTESATFK